MVKQLPGQTPAFVLDIEQVFSNLQPLQQLRHNTGCQVLYAIKALPLAALLKLMAGQIDGVAVSSLFEARLAADSLGEAVNLHLTTPGLRADEFGELSRLCSHISFNSWSQHQALASLASCYSAGLRVNPKLSFVDDARYDPCRAHSKLGVDLASLAAGLPDDLAGLHFHTVFSQTDFAPLLATIEQLKPILRANRQLKWLNLGGGYLYHSITEQQDLWTALNCLQQQFGLQVLVEPGKAMVGNAGYLVTTVLDSFVSDGKTVLILDTSVNHHPEVFEYQRQPQLLEHQDAGYYSAILAGCSCLAGDVFGEYRFERLPVVGERLVFAGVGAYSLIKASRFNGYNLPEVYLARDGQLTLIKRYSYQDYSQQWA